MIKEVVLTDTSRRRYRLSVLLQVRNLSLCVLYTSEFNMGIQFTNGQVRFAKEQDSVLIIN